MIDLIATISAAIFIAGIVAGVIAIVSIGIHREEKRSRRTRSSSLTRRPTGPTIRGARWLLGVYVKDCADSQPGLPPCEEPLV